MNDKYVIQPMDYSRCPECDRKQITNASDGSEHEEGCQIGCSEQEEYEQKLVEFRRQQGITHNFEAGIGCMGAVNECIHCRKTEQEHK